MDSHSKECLHRGLCKSQMWQEFLDDGKKAAIGRSREVTVSTFQMVQKNLYQIEQPIFLAESTLNLIDITADHQWDKTIQHGCIVYTDM